MLSITLIFVCLPLALAENIPALIWSSSRPLSDLPQSYTGQTIKTDSFQQSYLNPLAADGKHNIVIFLQDKLSLEDFTTHADVYNPSSDGGAFKNVKSAMDNQFSVHLPLVSDPLVAIDNLVTGFTGELHKVDNSDALQSLKLSGDKSNLILVTLMPTRGKPDAAAFTENDDMMGRCMHHLNKRGIDYSAIYTGRSSSQMVSESGYLGRHLLAEADVDSNNTCAFVSTPYEEKNDTAALIYLCRVNVTVVKDPKDPKTESYSGSITGDQLSVTVMNNTNEGNGTAAKDYNVTVTMTLEDDNMTLEINTTIRHYRGDWLVVNSTVDFVNKLNETFSITAPLGLDIVTAPNKFCFHCTKLRTMWNRADMQLNGTMQINLTFHSFQFDPFGNNTGNMTQFTDFVWDCVPFFSAPIWMAIITSAILMMILFFGLTMITNIQTMDRFDDPKGKTVTVTVNE